VKGEKGMRYSRERGIAALGIIVLAAGGALLLRILRHSKQRGRERDAAFETLRESGEHIFGPPPALAEDSAAE